MVSEEHCKQIHWHVWGMLAVDGPTGFTTAQGGMCFLGLHYSGSRLLCKGTVKMGCVFCAFPCLSCSGFSAAPQGHRPRWAVRFVPFRSQATQVPGCSVSALPQVDCMSYSPPGLGLSVFWRAKAHPQVCLCLLLGSLISGCDTPGGC